MILDDVLGRLGCPSAPPDFRDIVATWWELFNDGRSLVEFLARPDEVAEFCTAMRQLFRCPALPDDAIVLALAGETCGRVECARSGCFL